MIYLPVAKAGTTCGSVSVDLASLLTGPSEKRLAWLRRIGFFASTTLHHTLLFGELPGKEIAVRKAEEKYDRRYAIEIGGLTGRIFTNDLSAARRLADDPFFLRQREATVIRQEAVPPRVRGDDRAGQDLRVGDPQGEEMRAACGK